MDRNVPDACDLFEAFAGNQQVKAFSEGGGSCLMWAANSDDYDLRDLFVARHRRP